jgi:hypothetical protein
LSETLKPTSGEVLRVTMARAFFGDRAWRGCGGSAVAAVERVS